MLVGPNGIGNTQQYEYQLALTRQARDKQFPLIPVVLPGTETWQLPLGFLALQTWVSFAGAGGMAASPDQLQRLLAAILRETPDADAIRVRSVRTKAWKRSPKKTRHCFSPRR